MPRLVISAAHTSISPGAIYQDLREFDLTRKILQLVIPHLEKTKIEFKAVPVDMVLLDRIKWINDTGFNESNGDIFIEIHVNDGGKRGIESWFKGDTNAAVNNSKKLAETITEQLCKSTGYEKQGAKSEYDHELGSLLILNQTNPIGTAIELLFIDNPEDIKILKDDKQLDELAKKFADAVKYYVDNVATLQVKVAPKPAISNNNPFSLPGFDDDNDDPFGLNPFGAPPGGGGMGMNTPPASTANITMDREQRKTMIMDTYKKVLGTEPKQADLNYYLNTGVSEEQLLQKIVKTKEFETMVADAKEYNSKKDEFKKMEADNIKFQSQLKDFDLMTKKLHELLGHKNLQIKQMQDELVSRGLIKPGEYYDPARIKK